MKSVLLPTDFSDNAWSAAVYALKLYENSECTFYFINSCKTEVSVISNMSNKLLNIMKECAMMELLELKRMARIANANEKHNFEIILSSENIVDAINNTIKTHSIDMVVMGTKGASKAKEIFIGSNTVKVLKRVNSSTVLVVPDEFNFVAPTQIAFPTDYNRLHVHKELDSIKKIARVFNSKIRILHIGVEKKLSDIQEYNIKMLDENLANFEHSFHWMPDYDKKASVIQDFLDELNINILAMVNYRHSFIEKIILEPVIKTIGFHSKVPFLVIPE